MPDGQAQMAADGAGEKEKARQHTTWALVGCALVSQLESRGDAKLCEITGAPCDLV